MQHSKSLLLSAFVVMMMVLMTAVSSTKIHHNYGRAVVMESSFMHDKEPFGWKQSNNVLPKDQLITLTFALKLRNMDFLENLLLNEISNPRSSNYRQYLSQAEVSEMVSPLQENVNLLREWLVRELKAEITRDIPDFIVAVVPLNLASKWLDTQFKLYQHKETGKQVIRTLGPYSLPQTIADMVDFVGGTVRFPNSKVSSHLKPDHQFTTYYQKQVHNVDNSGSGEAVNNAPSIPRLYAGDGSFAFMVLPRCVDGTTSTSTQSFCASNPIQSIQVQSTNVNFQTAVSLSSMYCQSCSLFTNSLAQAVCQRSNQQLNLTATTVYCLSPELTSSAFVNYLPLNLTFTAVYGGNVQSQPFAYTTYLGQFLTPQTIQESYNMPLLEGSFPTNQSILPDGWNLNSQSVAEFLDQYYSTQDLEQFFDLVGLDSRLADRVYVVGPNNQSLPGGEASLDIQYLMGLAAGYNTTFWSTGGLVNGQEPFLEWITDVLNNNSIIYVHSISYGDDEDSLSSDYMFRINYEFIKAGAVGMTLVFSSGDVGVNSNTNPIGDQFYPAFPATSPYVTTVGATQVSTQTSPVCQSHPVGGLISVKCNQIGEIASSVATGSRITSGGGFSNVFSRPAYQDNVTIDYINTHLGFIPKSFYNTSGRSYPDVSAFGHNFIVILGGEIVPIDGTSAAAPTFASVISIINDMLIRKGEEPLGFFNPLLYQLAVDRPEAFTDIVMGDNSCPESLTCNQFGFPAVPGYDAVTGFGSPLFDVLSHIIVHGDDY